MIIKVCGMRDAENIREVERLGIDMMGFICWERSPRFVGEVPAYLPECPRVGVFVNPSLDYVLQQTEAFGFSYIQLHGTESPEFCHTVREKTGCKVIKAISIDPPTPFRGSNGLEVRDWSMVNGQWSMVNGQWSMYEGCTTILLFDTKCPTHGGSGQKFSWDILSGYRGDLPFLLSGGIGPEDAEQLRQFHHEKCLGFDINSRFEVEPGIKDVEKIKQFITALRNS